MRTIRHNKLHMIAFSTVSHVPSRPLRRQIPSKEPPFLSDVPSKEPLFLSASPLKTLNPKTSPSRTMCNSCAGGLPRSTVEETLC